jgi:Protein of unknown function (DUF4435)
MRELLSFDREANAIRLRRSTFLGTFLLVEGSSDKLVYDRVIDSTLCTIVVVAGKPSSKLRAIAILEILEKSNFSGILAIVDADFDRLDTDPYQNPNLLRTDTHDLETLLIQSPALDKVLAEFGSEEKLKKFDRDVRTALLEAGASVGYLLWISQRDKLNLTFEGIAFSKFVDEKTLQIDEQKLIQEVKNKSQALSLKNEELHQTIIALKSKHYDPWQVCCGHHLVEILSLSLRKAIGSNTTSNVEPNRLEQNLRLAYEAAYFRQTQLYLDIQIWETDHQPFRVLQGDRSKC